MSRHRRGVATIDQPRLATAGLAEPSLSADDAARGRGPARSGCVFYRSGGARMHQKLGRGLGALWCTLVYHGAMPTVEKPIRQSVTLPQGIARRIKSLAKSSRTSANRILVELIESGLEARDQERNRFLEMADRLARTGDPKEQRHLKEELARMTFGE